MSEFQVVTREDALRVARQYHARLQSLERKVANGRRSQEINQTSLSIEDLSAGIELLNRRKAELTEEFEALVRRFGLDPNNLFSEDHHKH